MGTLQFNKNGPVIVTEEDSKIFQRSNYSSFDQMFYDWLDENNRNGVRRLIIRDLLRQAHGTSNPDTTHYQTEHGFGRIMHIGGGNKSKDLYWTLRNRPRLLNEITSELLYNLEHDYVPLQSIGKDSFVQLLELLLTVAPKSDVTKLWQYHPINAEKNLPLPKLMSERLRLYTGRANLPQFLRDELWQKISQDLTAAINAQKKALLKNGIPSITENCTMQTVINFLDAVINESYHDDNRSADMVTDCIILLERVLPLKVIYFNHIDLERITKRIQNKQSTCTVICRHIDQYTEEELSYTNINFLYWVRGIITFHQPEQTACLEKIDARLANPTEHEIVFA